MEANGKSILARLPLRTMISSHMPTCPLKPVVQGCALRHRDILPEWSNAESILLHCPHGPLIGHLATQPDFLEDYHDIEHLRSSTQASC